MLPFLLLIPILFLAPPRAFAADGSSILDNFDALGEWRPMGGRPTPSIDRTSDAREGAAGRALQVHFPESDRDQFVGRSIEAGPAWDTAAGLSFWFRGDGSNGFVAVSLLDDTFTKRYAALVSLKEKGWRRVRLRWTDFVPEVLTADWLGQPGGNMKPSDVRALWVGRWFYLQPWSRCSFALDDLCLEAVIDRPVPAPPPEAGRSPGMPLTLARLKAGQPVTIAVLGDSITYGTRLDDPAAQAFPALLQRLLREKYKYVGVRVVNAGVPGIETRQGIVLLPREVAGCRPDLVIAHFGYNDFSSMQVNRIPEDQRKGLAEENWRQLVARVRALPGRELEGGGAEVPEVLLVATTPGADAVRHHALDFFGDAARHVAGAAGCAFTEAPRQAFRTALEDGVLEELFARTPKGKLDVAHLNEAGHLKFAEALMKSFEQILQPVSGKEDTK
ncbi:MAG: GDSL-type esterase/lipase family protein [Planctomycetes bacterium]|nr:GDSL-type esterase/lipase family protein [Planctomycetota bacterium]